MSDQQAVTPETDAEIRFRLRAFAQEVGERADTQAAIERLRRRSHPPITNLMAIAAAVLAVVALAAGLRADGGALDVLDTADSPTQTAHCPKTTQRRVITLGGPMNTKFVAPIASAAAAETVRRTVGTIFAGLLLVALPACDDSDNKSEAAAPTTRGNETSTTTTTAALVYRSEAATAPPTGALTVGMSSFKFTPQNLAVKAGTVVFYLVNEDVPAPGAQGGAEYLLELSHSLAVQSKATGFNIAASDRIAPTKAAVFTIESLPAGQYTIVCTIPGHGFRGQKGTLEVTA